MGKLSLETTDGVAHKSTQSSERERERVPPVITRTIVCFFLAKAEEAVNFLDAEIITWRRMVVMLAACFRQNSFYLARKGGWEDH